MRKIMLSRVILAIGMMLIWGIYGVTLFVASSDCSAASYPQFTTTPLTTDLSMNQYKLYDMSDIITKGPWVDARIYNGGAFNDVTISQAITDIGAAQKTLLLAPGTWTISANVTVPSNINLRFEQGAVLLIGSGFSFAINGPIDAPIAQIFSGNGTVAIGCVGVAYPEWWGAKGDGITDDTLAIQGAINGANEGKVIYFLGNYAVTGELTITRGITFKSGVKNPSGNVVGIIYTGAIDITKAVIRTTNVQNLIISGLTINANANAGYCLIAESTTGVWSLNNINKCLFKNWRASGLFINGTYENDMSLVENCRFYQGAVSGTYAVHVGAGANVSTWTFRDCSFDANSSYQLKNAVYLQSSGGDFTFEDCTFAQTVPVSGTDGYAIYSAGGWVNLVRVWNEASGLLHQSTNSAAEATSNLIGVHGQGLTYFNNSAMSLNIEGGRFSDDVIVDSAMKASTVSIKGARFLSGKGLYDNLRNVRITGFGINDAPTASYTYTGGSVYFLSGFAELHIITLQSNLTNLQPPDASPRKIKIIFKQDATGGRSVTWSPDWKFVGNSPPTLSTAPNAVDYIEFINNGLEFSETDRALAIGGTGVPVPGSFNPTTYNMVGTLQTDSHIVRDSVTLSSGISTVNLLGASVFTSASSYSVTLREVKAGTSTQNFTVEYVSGNQFKIRSSSGTSTATVRFIAVGN